ncbi:MAG: DUF1905 domain-containing protein [Actinomycetales bacterium]|nr:DUF1905 domain-containing protein [Actinomycetales bacterium]
MDCDFTAPLWRWHGDGAWFFLTVPEDLSDELEDAHGGHRGFGSIRVEVTVGTTTWRTSVFPSSQQGAFILPVKKQVRQREGLDEGDLVNVHVVAYD